MAYRGGGRGGRGDRGGQHGPPYGEGRGGGGGGWSPPAPAAGRHQPANVPVSSAPSEIKKLIISETALAPPAAAVAATQEGEDAAAEDALDLAPVSDKGLAHPRPPGVGTVGKKVMIRANHFLVDVADNNLFQYNVSSNPESKSRQTNREVLNELIKLHGQTPLGGKLPAYDGRKRLHTAGSLPFKSEEFVDALVDPEKEEKEMAEYKIMIQIAGRTDMYHLMQFLRERKRDVGEGLECWRGYYQSLRPTQMGLSLNIDTSATSFFKYTEDRFAKEFDVQVCNDLVSVPAPVLPPPLLKCHHSGREKVRGPNSGQWNMINKKMFNGGTLDNWTCLNFSLMCPEKVHRFCMDLILMCNGTGMAVNPQPLEVKSVSPYQIESALRDVYSRGSQICATQGIQLLIVILPDGSDSYGKIKQVCETGIGIVYQCCFSKDASKPNKEYLEKVALEIKVKVGQLSAVEQAFVSKDISFVSEVTTEFFPREDSTSFIPAVVASSAQPLREEKDQKVHNVNCGSLDSSLSENNERRVHNIFVDGPYEGTICVQIGPDGLASDLKTKVEEMKCIKLENQLYMTFKGIELLSSVPLLQQGISNNSQISVTGRLRGGVTLNDHFNDMTVFILLTQLPDGTDFPELNDRGCISAASWVHSYLKALATDRTWDVLSLDHFGVIGDNDVVSNLVDPTVPLTPPLLATALSWLADQLDLTFHLNQAKPSYFIDLITTLREMAQKQTPLTPENIFFLTHHLALIPSKGREGLIPLMYAYYDSLPSNSKTNFDLALDTASLDGKWFGNSQKDPVLGMRHKFNASRKGRYYQSPNTHAFRLIRDHGQHSPGDANGNSSHQFSYNHGLELLIYVIFEGYLASVLFKLLCDPAYIQHRDHIRELMRGCMLARPEDHN